MFIKEIIKKYFPFAIRWVRSLSYYCDNFLLSTLYIIYFNFRYLPLSQAIHLPIWISVRNYRQSKGRIKIESSKVHTGMIQIGGAGKYFFEKRGVFLYSKGTIIFKGGCIISNGCIIQLFDNAILTFGENSGISTTKILCQTEITIGKRTMIGIDSMLMDSDFHPVIDLISHKYLAISKPIKIGNYCFIGAGCLLMKGTVLPNGSIVSARSILNKKYKFPECSIISTSPNSDSFEEGFICDWINTDIFLKTKKVEDFDNLVKKLSLIQ